MNATYIILLSKCCGGGGGSIYRFNSNLFWRRGKKKIKEYIRVYYRVVFEFKSLKTVACTIKKTVNAPTEIIETFRVGGIMMIRSFEFNAARRSRQRVSRNVSVVCVQ